MLLELKIERFENDKAILKSENNETIIWPRNNLPKEVKEGSLLAFIIKSDGEKEKDHKELAKDILNEILDIDETKQ